MFSLGSCVWDKVSDNSVEDRTPDSGTWTCCCTVLYTQNLHGAWPHWTLLGLELMVKLPLLIGLLTLTFLKTFIQMMVLGSWLSFGSAKSHSQDDATVPDIYLWTALGTIYVLGEIFIFPPSIHVQSYCHRKHCSATWASKRADAETK